MSDGTVRPAGDVLRVLVVGDSRRIETAIQALSSTFDPASLVREQTIGGARERLADADAGIDDPVHCLVCEFGSDRTSLDDSQLQTLEAETDVPIITVTDGADIAAIDRALEAGATDIVNPGDSRALVATRVRNAARQYQRADSRDGRRSESERRSETVLEHADALVFVLTADGSITYASPAVESRLGYTSSELERTSLEHIVHPDDRERVLNTVAAISSEPLGSSERTVVRVGDGADSWRRVELTCSNRLADPDVAGIVVTATATTTETATDALERNDSPSDHDRAPVADAAETDVDTEIEAGTHERLSLLESAIDALEDGIAILEDETIRLVNGSLVDLTGERSLIGEGLEELFEADLAKTIRERARSPVVRWMEPVRGELRTDNELIPVDVVVTPLPDEDDRTLCLVRDRRDSPAAILETLTETLEELREATARSHVAQSVANGIRSCVGAELAVWYRLESETLSAAAVATADEQPPVELPPLDREGVETDHLAVDSPTVFDRVALESLLEHAGIRAERVLVVPIGDRGVVLATHSDPMAFEALDFGPPRALADAATVSLARLKAETQARDCHARESDSRQHSLANDRFDQLSGTCCVLRPEST